MQVGNQEAMKRIIASVNQQKRQAMTMQLPQMHPPHFVPLTKQEPFDFHLKRIGQTKFRGCENIIISC